MSNIMSDIPSLKDLREKVKQLIMDEKKDKLLTLRQKISKDAIQASMQGINRLEYEYFDTYLDTKDLTPLVDELKSKGYEAATYTADSRILLRIKWEIKE